MSSIGWMCGLVSVLCVAAFAASVRAQSAPKNVAVGQRLASEHCARCHVAVLNGEAGWTDAPSFAAIANRPQTTAAKLSAFIQQPHMHMLDLPLPPVQANAVAAYIISLRAS
jgi:cytochrome c